MAEQVVKEMVEHTQKVDPAHAQEVGKQASAAEKKANLDLITRTLNEIEAKTLSGAPTLTPKEVLLDLSDLKAKYPDKVVRWVNVRAPGVADRRRLDGYIRLPESDGGRELAGEVAVFITSQRLHDVRVEKIKKMNKDRLHAHKAEVENIAEGIVRELRDRYGLRVPIERLLVNEEG